MTPTIPKLRVPLERERGSRGLMYALDVGGGGGAQSGDFGFGTDDEDAPITDPSQVTGVAISVEENGVAHGQPNNAVAAWLLDSLVLDWSPEDRWLFVAEDDPSIFLIAAPIGRPVFDTTLSWRHMSTAELEPISWGGAFTEQGQLYRFAYQHRGHGGFVGPPDRAGGFLTVEQDSVDEVAQCVYAILATPLGSRLEEPGFGIEHPDFAQVPLDLSQFSAAIDAWEPRADYEGDQTFADEVLTVRERVSAS